MNQINNFGVWNQGHVGGDIKQEIGGILDRSQGFSAEGLAQLRVSLAALVESIQQHDGRIDDLEDHLGRIRSMTEEIAKPRPGKGVVLSYLTLLESSLATIPGVLGAIEKIRSAIEHLLR